MPSSGSSPAVGRRYTPADGSSRRRRPAWGRSSRSTALTVAARRRRPSDSLPIWSIGASSIHLTREPGGTWLGERIRELLLERTGSTAPTDPLADALLFNAARRQLVREVIRTIDSKPARPSSAPDTPTRRWPTRATVPASTLDLRALAETATDGLHPDLTIVLDLPVEVGLARKAPGDVTRFEAEYDLAFHRRVRDGFLAIAAAEPGRVVVIDATGSVDDVSAAVADAVDRRSIIGEPSGPPVRSTR